jgi:hypothetical protein
MPSKLPSRTPNQELEWRDGATFWKGVKLPGVLRISLTTSDPGTFWTPGTSWPAGIETSPKILTIEITLGPKGISDEASQFLDALAITLKQLDLSS